MKVNLGKEQESMKKCISTIKDNLNKANANMEKMPKLNLSIWKRNLSKCSLDRDSEKQKGTIVRNIEMMNATIED